MQLSHFTETPLLLNREFGYAQPAWEIKPSGLWVSVDGEYDWPWFCDAGDFRADRLVWRNIIELASGANILVLDSPEAIHALSKSHGRSFPGMPGPFQRIDWNLLSKSYQGIIIAPYQWASRHAEFWYYSWDVASGCIWDLSVIASVESVRYVPEEAIA